MLRYAAASLGTWNNGRKIMALNLIHSKYSFLRHTGNTGDSACIGTNPFSDETVRFPIVDSFTDDEIGALQEVFDENGA